MSEAAEASEPDWLEFDLADRLRRALRISRTSVQAMATELDVERNTVGNYINGHTKPPRPTLVVWAMRTGVPIEWLETGNRPDANVEAAALPRLDSNQQPFVSQSTQVSATDAEPDRGADLATVATVTPITSRLLGGWITPRIPSSPATGPVPSPRPAFPAVAATRSRATDPREVTGTSGGSVTSLDTYRASRTSGRTRRHEETA